MRGKPLQGGEYRCAFASSYKSSAWGAPKAKDPVMVLVALHLPPHTPPCCVGSSCWGGFASRSRRDAGSPRARMDDAVSIPGEALTSAMQLLSTYITFIPSNFDFLWV